ncbi:unnamed protein product [Mytilus coruscus]|uniref:C2H2-type domain-containing protein n=1 Tax=Mytilus coruscus TaxID=42192 RepID=A0A6J8AYE9_MYTCO|nr:unnamed protein product [Mytilus coruscus]
MSSVITTKCWLCPETFEKKKDLKSHAIFEHSVCIVVCPWCVDSERTFGRISELTKHCKRKHNDLTIDLLDGDFFTEPNGFWLAKRPEDYIKIIKPSEWTSTIAIRTRAALLGWVETNKKEGADKFKKIWEEGWKKVLGHSVASEQPTSSRKRKYSPSRPLVDLIELSVARIDLSSRGKIAYLRMKETSAEIWFKVELVHWVMEDSKAKDNLLRRMGIAKVDYEPPQTFGTELKLVESKQTLNQVTKALGIGKRHVRKLFRGKITFEVQSRKTSEGSTKDETSCRSDIGEESEYEIMDSIGEVDYIVEEEQPEKAQMLTSKTNITNQAHNTAEVHQPSKCPSSKLHLAEKEHQSNNPKSASEKEHHLKEPENHEPTNYLPIMISQKEVYEIETDEEDNVKDSLTVTAETLLKVGGMPLFPPGRRQWTGESLQLSVKPTPMFWPPRDWRKLSADQKLTAWRFAAMTLAREHGADTVKEETDILDKYALPGTAVVSQPGKDQIIKARLANYQLLKDICLRKLSGNEARELVTMLEADTRSQIPNHFVKLLEREPLRLSEDVKKDK